MDRNLRPDIKECEFLLKTLVRMNTSQPEGNEAVLAEWICEEIQKWGGPEDLEISFLEHTTHRKSLLVKVKGRKGGTGKREDKGPAFIGHIDTVACEEKKNWLYPPLRAIVKDGVLYGRGAADMKGGVAAMMLAMRYLLGQKGRLDFPVFFCFTADEEKDGLGAKALAAKQEWMEQIDSMFICEPSNQQIGCCEKGALWLRVEIRGASAHASRPEIGLNAIEYAMQFEREYRTYINQAVRHEMLGNTTMSITKLKGGIMTNIIPDEAVMEMDIRTVPGVSHEECIKAARKIAEEMEKDCAMLQCSVSVMNNRPAVETAPGHPFVKKVCGAAQKTGMSGELRGLYFYTDASQLIPQTGIPFVIAGPGDDKMAHCVNEKIALEEVAQMTEVYLRYLLNRE